MSRVAYYFGGQSPDPPVGLAGPADGTLMQLPQAEPVGAPEARVGLPVFIKTGYIYIFAPVYFKEVMCLAGFGLINCHRLAQLNKRG